MTRATGLKKGQTLKNVIYSDSEISIEYDRNSYTLKHGGRYPTYYTSLASLLRAICESNMKKALSISSLDIPVEQFREIADKLFNDIKSIASVIRFASNA